MIRNTNDGSAKPPYLRLDLNYWNSHDLPSFSKGPYDASDWQRHRAIKDAGYIGVQDGNPEICKEIGLRLTGQYRINKVGGLTDKIQEWTDGPYTAPRYMWVGASSRMLRSMPLSTTCLVRLQSMTFPFTLKPTVPP